MSPSKKKNWNVEMKCTVTKDVHLSDCTETEALLNPWHYSDDERENGMSDWEVISVKEDV
jgi:hypothetical protein